MIDPSDARVILEGVRLIGVHGSDAADLITAACDAGELDAAYVGEAAAQLEDLCIARGW